jgi:DNA invertase Pin-like site-specific DNA recombinase
MLVGYMRVSTDSNRQVLDLQRDALVAAGVDERHGGRPTAIDAEKLAAVIAALDAGATKAAVCRTFGIKRSTLIDSLARVGWSAGIKVREA